MEIKKGIFIIRDVFSSDRRDVSLYRYNGRLYMSYMELSEEAARQ